MTVDKMTEYKISVDEVTVEKTSVDNKYKGEGKTTYTFSVSVNTFSVQFP